ncbi:MAG: efflux transporter outer membrane subunit [Planctomycetota bacterium]|jgi:NodT family efflux transporter outer membrane factor (OMF) lipoprotein
MKKKFVAKAPLANRVLGAITAAVLVMALGGCMVGPDYKRPPVEVNDSWLESSAAISDEPAEVREWWTSFNDPVLTALVNKAYEQNLTLRAAGLRVIQARAARGIAVGEFFPQEQRISARYSNVNLSDNNLNNPPFYDFAQAGVSIDAAWELDLWGKFRRNINAADAALLASIADYDDVLVSLVAEVGLVYVEIRTLERRIELAKQNVRIQQKSFELAESRFRNGAVGKLDVAEAGTTLANTQSTVPDLESSLRTAKLSLCVLLGQSVSELEEELAGGSGIPLAPVEVTIGVPADLLRRRPDVRAAERVAAFQSEQIGIATADLFPSISISGSAGLEASDAGGRELDNLYDASSFKGFIGPTLSWPILNYGRIMNNKRIQDAAFQEAAVNYQNTVLKAAAEVESAVNGFIKARESLSYLTESSEYARQSLELSRVQYLEGQTDFQRVDLAALGLSLQQDRQAVTEGLVATTLISVYKTLGGGWELRRGREFVPQETVGEMTDRTNWGDILDPDYTNGTDLGFPRPDENNE